jgi:putative SOS response-associated peptidase YedK
MPAILAPKRVGAWLDSPWDEARQLLQPAPSGLLEAVRISTRINSVANDDRACLEPAADGGQFGLF